MDSTTFAHLSAWITQHVRAEDQVSTLSRIMDFTRDYPDLLDRLGWTEIRELAERVL